MRILVLGDSYGEAMEVQYEETAAKVLEQQLNARLATGELRERESAASRTPATALFRPGRQRDTHEWYITRTLFRRLQASAEASGAGLLVANVHYRNDDFLLRQPFFVGMGLPLVDVSADLTDPGNRYGLHYRHDGHWNAQGHARAATLIADQIVAENLLPVTTQTQHVETINTSMSAYSTCKELMLFEAEGVKYAPDLVLVLYTAADERNVADSGLCRVEADSTVTLHPATYSPSQELIRGVRGHVRSRFHFLTFVLDRLTRIEAMAPWNAGRAEQGVRNVSVD